jgi:hypothetical protein
MSLFVSHFIYFLFSFFSTNLFATTGFTSRNITLSGFGIHKISNSSSISQSKNLLTSFSLSFLS